jgi:hypothetical protein
MARVALLTMSDGRDFVARDLTGFCQVAEDAVATALAAAGHQVELGGEPVSTSGVATSSAGRLEFLSRFGANHIHAVPGDRIAELRAACTFLGISFEPLGSPPD